MSVPEEFCTERKNRILSESKELTNILFLVSVERMALKSIVLLMGSE